MDFVFPYMSKRLADPGFPMTIPYTIKHPVPIDRLFYNTLKLSPTLNRYFFIAAASSFSAFMNF